MGYGAFGPYDLSIYQYISPVPPPVWLMEEDAREETNFYFSTKL
jgi:hypothetical protein